MKIIALVSKRRVLAEVDPEDLAGLLGLSSAYNLQDRVKGIGPGGEFTADIIGREINVTSIFADAKTALDLHKTAVGSADQLKRAASRFLGFFAEEK